jgi:putative oxidoreductase
VRKLDYVVRRLFSTFAHGAPGLGLLLLRVVAGMCLVFQAVIAMRDDPPVASTLLYMLTGALGALLLVGLWTPVSGTVLAIIASSSAFLHQAEFLNGVLLAALGAGLALLGPGAWSVDAHLFGWKRVELPDKKI